MPYQTVFSRYELKYILTLEQKNRIIDIMIPYMELDKYGRTTIRNIYYDTANYRLIRESIDKPIYKEKLRIRSYSQVSAGDTVFVELKKKYQSVVYKRRLPLSETEAMNWVNRKQACKEDTQISREIDYFLDYYDSLRPVAFISYEREAYKMQDKSDFRVTFDDTILFRDNKLSLTESIYGESILNKGLVLMELKCSGGIPLWMTLALTKNRIYKTSFSKYGTAYSRFIFPRINNTEDIYYE